MCWRETGRLRKSSSKLPEVDELALGSAAASIAAADMGIKISFKSKAEARSEKGKAKGRASLNLGVLW